MANALTYFARSETGLVRPTNQDRYGTAGSPPALPSSFILADGMGGHRNGQLAAEIAVSNMVSSLERNLPQDNIPELIIAELEDAIQKANVKVYLESLESAENYGMGTTLTMVVIYADSVYVTHIGDSRCYLLRNGQLEQLTADQNVAGALVDSGAITREEGRTHPDRNVLTQALGSSRYLNPEVLHLDRRPNDRLLLCSDGLHGPVPDADIRQVLRKAKNPESAVNQLTELALAAGAPDNVTSIVIFSDGSRQ